MQDPVIAGELQVLSIAESKATWLFQAQGEGAFDRKDYLGLLFALARDLLGRAVSMDILL